MGNGTDAMPPLPPLNSGISRGMSELSTASQSQKSSRKTKKQELTFFDKVFGVSKKRKKKEAEEAKNLLNFYDNFEKDLRRTLKDLLVDDVEQRSWLNLWVKIDPRRTNTMGFSSFCEVFSMSNKCIWSKRVYEIMNANFTSGVSFTEFVQFCSTYLVLDEEKLHAFTFRLLSRRGTSDEKTILDLQDIKTYIKFKFKKTLKKANFDKISLEVLKAVEQITDYGIRQEDIAAYCKKNPSIIAFSNGFLTHLRMCIFGYFFWVERSQQLKKKSSSGLSSMGFLKNANIDSQRLITSLHKIHGIKTRVPKKFRPKKEKSQLEDESNKRAIGAGIPLEIKISQSKSADSKENPSPGKGKGKGTASGTGIGGARSPAKPNITSGVKMKVKPKKEGRKSNPRKSVITAAKLSVDPNLFKVEDDLIIGGIEDLPEVDLAFGDDVEDSQFGNVEMDKEAIARAVSSGSIDHLPDIEQKNITKAISDEKEIDEEIQKQSVAVSITQVETNESPDIGKQRSSSSQKIVKQESGLGRQNSSISLQISKQMSWISRQSSWLSGTDTKVEEEPDEETAEEKAVRVASLRYYPIGFNIDLLLNTTFEKDFPDIVTARATAKSDKLAKMREKMKIDLIAEQRTYNLMTQVLDDLVHQKRGKRIAFGRWLDCVGMIEQSNNVTNYRIQFKPVENRGKKEIKNDVVLSESDDAKKEESDGKFGFGMFGKNKKKAAAALKEAEVKAEQQRKKQEEEKEKKVGWVSFSDDEDDKPEVAMVEGNADDDAEFELHRKIVRMTSSIQDRGVDDTAFNEYMDEFKARCIMLQPDRTKIIERESADFMATLKQSTEDTAKKVVVYGDGVEYIAKKLYLPENHSKNEVFLIGENP